MMNNQDEFIAVFSVCAKHTQTFIRGCYWTNSGKTTVVNPY